MADFRKETFLQFVLQAKPFRSIISLWFALIVGVVICLFLGWNTYMEILFLIIAFPLALLADVLRKYVFYASGRKAFLELNDSNAIVLNDVDLYIRGFDGVSLNDSSKIVPRRTPFYQLSKADLILSGCSIILMGKDRLMGWDLYAPAIEMSLSAYSTNAHPACITKWYEERDRIIVEIHDAHFIKPFKIEFKNCFAEIKGFLSVNR